MNFPPPPTFLSSLLAIFHSCPCHLPLNPTYKGPVTGCSDTPSLSPVTQTETMLPQIMAPSFSKLLLVCLLLVGLECGETASTAAAAAPAAAASFRRACPEGSKAFGSYCYGLFSMLETWDAAEVNCQSQTSGHLVSLMNEAEASFVASLVAESGGSRCGIWIGLYDPNKTRRWKWSSNALFTYQSWATKAPSSTSPGYCAALTQDTGFKNWKDQLCSNKNFYICKFKS